MPLAIDKRGKYFHIRWDRGRVHVVRASLGTRNEDAALRLKSRIENAVAEGSDSPEWIELANVLPPRTYTRFEQALGIKRAKLYTWDELSASSQDGKTIAENSRPLQIRNPSI
jgi:hypothetical protein